MSLKHKLQIGRATSCLMFVIVLVRGCSKRAEAPQAAAPLEVEVAQVEQQDVPIQSEWIGTLDGMVNAEIRAQVSVTCSETTLKAPSSGREQLLFEIDARPFQAAVDQAKVRLARAQAQLTQADGQLLQSQAQVTRPRRIRARLSSM